MPKRRSDKVGYNELAFSFLAEVADTLLWREVSRKCDAFKNLYCEHLEEVFQRHISETEKDASLADGLMVLPATTRRNFIRAPQVANWLIGARRHGFEIDVSFLAEALLAELILAGLVDGLTQPIWTARGDRQLTALDPSIRSPGDYVAGIVIDDSSPHVFPYDGISQKILVQLSCEDRASVRANIASALQALSLASKVAFSFVTSYIDTIAVRSEPGQPSVFHSSSFSRYIGLALLTNPHLKEVDLAKLTDVLVHEAIHSMLFMIEEMGSPFVRSWDSIDITLVSPWSGRSLGLHSYVHACIVWYGLYWFWRGVADTDVYPVDRCNFLMRRAASGFASCPVSRILAPRRELLSWEVGSVLDEIEARMTSI